MRSVDIDPRINKCHAFHRKVHVTPLSYRGTGCAGDRKQRPHAPEPAPLTREAQRSAGERWCYSLKVRAWA